MFFVLREYGNMARKPTGNPNGRPPKEINQEQFEALCRIQCTEEEICSVLGVDEATLIKWCKANYGETFSKIFKDKKLGGKASLRRMQWKLAEKNVTMSIWLGKQYLGQSEQIQTYEAQRTQETIEGLKGLEIKFVDGGINENDKGN